MRRLGRLGQAHEPRVEAQRSVLVACRYGQPETGIFRAWGGSTLAEGSEAMNDGWRGTSPMRGNLLDRPFAADRLTFASVYPGVQLWPRRGHVKVSFEYGFANQDEPEIGAVQAEVAF